MRWKLFHEGDCCGLLATGEKPTERECLAEVILADRSFVEARGGVKRYFQVFDGEQEVRSGETSWLPLEPRDLERGD